MLNRALLYINTIKYLRVSQILNRVKRKFIKPKIKLLKTPKLSNSINAMQSTIQHSQRMYGKGSFKFLNKEFTLGSFKDWNPSDQDKLWIYNLHYFDDLNAINSEERIVWHYELVESWIHDNPYGYGNGWEPYPSSLRIVNWIKWFLLNNDSKQNWMDSLSIQTEFLSQNIEYHILGNHLFSNAKALVFAGLFFKGKEADKWYQTGINIVKIELSEQVLIDGGNFELSPMYHSIFLEDLIDLVNIHQVYKRSLPDNLEKKISQMLGWLKCMSHPDGEISFFNDSAFDVAPLFADLFDYAGRLNIPLENNNMSENSLIYFKESGYFIVKKENLFVIADVAKIGPDYIPGHGHADTLSFEMSLFGERIIVNSGISSYNSGLDRYKQRSTAAHSTIVLNDKNSSEVWSAFRVARRAQVFNIKSIEDNNSIKFSACHDGYKRLKGNIMHCREWNVKRRLIEIIDEVSGKGVHNVRSVIPLHPKVLLIDINKNFAELEINNKIFRISFEGKGTLQILKSQYHPEFGLSIDNQHLIYDYNGSLPFKTLIRITW